eukprot:546108_1
MTLTEKETVIVGCIIGSVIVIIFGLLLWYFCADKQCEEPDYSKLHTRVTTKKPDQDHIDTDPDVRHGIIQTETQSILTNESDININIDIEDDDDDDNVEITPDNERTSTINTDIATTPTNGSRSTQNKDQMEAGRVIAVDEVQMDTAMDIKEDIAIDECQNISETEDEKSTTEATNQDNEHNQGSECSEEDELDPEQIQFKIEKDIALHLLSDDATISESDETYSDTYATHTTYTDTLSTCVNLEEYKENLKHLFDLFSGNAQRLSWNKFNTFLDIVMITNTNHWSSWNLRVVDKGIARNEFVQYLCTRSICTHIEKQVSWKLLTKVWKGLNEIDANRSGLLDYDAFRSFGEKLQLDYKEIDTFWKRLVTDTHPSTAHVTITDVFEWFQQRLEALVHQQRAQRCEHVATSDSFSDNEECSSITTSGSISIVDSA